MAVTVSVIVAAYNAEPFIALAVRSALDQTLSDIELIVVDDGSSDDTAGAAAAAALDDPRFRLLRRAPNAGVAAARNAALELARGRWLAVLDADDTFTPDRLERLVERADAAGADLLADNVTLVHADGRVEAAFAVPERFTEHQLDAKTFIALDTPGLETLPLGFMKPIIRRDFVERMSLRYPEDITSGEDFDLYVRCLLRGARLLFVRESYYRALVRSDSLSRANPERNNAALLRSLDGLMRDAGQLGNQRAARMLARRATDIRSYRDYSELSDALHRRKFTAAAHLFRRLLLGSYMWRRFGMAARRRVAGRLTVAP